MKKTNLLVVAILFCITNSMGQTISPIDYAYDSLDINNIKAMFNANGELFTHYDSIDNFGFPSIGMIQGFEVPKDSNNHTFFNANLWIAGKDEKDSLHVAAQTYAATEGDFYFGPIMDSLSYSETQDSLWNKVWKVNKADVDDHVANWSNGGYVLPQSFVDWPAHGDTSLGQAYYLAPFYDYDGDRKYDPYQGDYPLIRGDQAVYFIFNDDRGVHKASGGKKLKVEIHAMAYAYKEASDTAQYNTIYINYRIINRSSHTYNNTYVGLFGDLDIGNYSDDFIGSDVQRGSYYAYNGDQTDEDFMGANGYGYAPPAQSVTFLAGPCQDNDSKDNAFGIDSMESINGYGFGDGTADNERLGMSSFAYFTNPSNGGTWPLHDPNKTIDYYNYMQAIWLDTTHMVYCGNGYYMDNKVLQPTVEAHFMFPGNTNTLFYGTNGVNTDSCIWTEENMGNTPGDRSLSMHTSFCIN